MNDSRSNFINLHRVWLRLLEKCTWKFSLTRIARWSVIIFYLPHYVWIKKNYDLWPIEKWFFIQHIFSMLAQFNESIVIEIKYIRQKYWKWGYYFLNVWRNWFLIKFSFIFFQRITWNPLEVDQSLCLLKGKTHVSTINN